MDKKQKNMDTNNTIKEDLLKLTVVDSLISSVVWTLKFKLLETEDKILSTYQISIAGLLLSYADNLLTYEILERSNELTDEIKEITLEYSKKLIHTLKDIRPVLIESDDSNIDGLINDIKRVIKQIEGENNENWI